MDHQTIAKLNFSLHNPWTKTRSPREKFFLIMEKQVQITNAAEIVV